MVMKNPFVTNGYAGPEYFCDRMEETQHITEMLTNENNMALISPRRIGKTALIHHCFAQPVIQKDYYTFIIDIYSTNSVSDLVNMFGKAIIDALRPKGRSAWEKFLIALSSLRSEISFDINGAPVWGIGIGNIVNPEITLDEIFSYINQADKPCLVAIDEFQQIGYYPEKNMEAILRTYIQKCSNANFIFSGSERHLISKMFSEKAHPFYNSADMMNLEVIPLDKYKEFAIRLFGKFDKKIKEKAIEQVYQAFGGNTYYMQKVMHEAFNQTVPQAEADCEMIEGIIHALVLDNDHKFSEILSRLTLPQKELLYAVAKEGMASQITSSGFVKKHRLRSASSVQSAVKKLLEYHLISTSQSAYYIDDQLMNLWLKE